MEKMTNDRGLPTLEARGASGVSFAWRLAGLACLLALGGVGTPSVLGQGAAPMFRSIGVEAGAVVVGVDLPAGYRHAVLESGAQVTGAGRESLVSGAVHGGAGVLTFRFPAGGETRFLQVRLGPEPEVPSAAYGGAGHFQVVYRGDGDAPLSALEKAGHVLNRLGYGPTVDDLAAVEAMGAGAWVEQQLKPDRVDEASNRELQDREAGLFKLVQPAEETRWISIGDPWRYFKGTHAPPSGWAGLGFDAGGWLEGPTGIGYGDNDDATVLTDMRQAAGVPGYLSVYARRVFRVRSVEDIDTLLLRVDYDDGFVAYLNGEEVARANVTGTPPSFDTATPDDHEAGSPQDFDLTSRRSLLRVGDNVLAIQVHNRALSSSDLTLLPELLGRKMLPVPPQKRIRGLDELQQLVHVRGIFARRQLQAVLGEFWENHFTTDYDKVAEYLSGLRNSDASVAMTEAQAFAEAAQLEWEEYQFFHDHALGYFGDLLLRSATSPAQLIYLDNVLNVKGAPNENYAREILELFAFGVDNRYTQTDIEQLARCFTGWSIRKIWPGERLEFPASARTPPVTDSVQFEDLPVVDLGAGWKYFKGTAEPTPGPDAVALTAWTRPDFGAVGWLGGSTGMGYGDGDDATVLSDMQGRYLSVYLRREFTVQDVAALEALLLSVDYDDGFVAYLNGTEVARSRTMQSAGTPPPFDRPASGGHEAGRGAETFSLKPFLSLLRPAPQRNVLAIQAHNISLGSSDLSILPRLVDRRPLPGSIENGDANGLWTFRFNPVRHDTNSKSLFLGTPQARVIPGGRAGLDGLKDAIEVVDAMVDHPSTAEFICLKLVNRFVSDEITLTTYHNGTAPEPLRRLMDAAIAAWHSTRPAGHIETVLRAVLDPAGQGSPFWARSSYQAKVKTPVEFINSSVRALRASVAGTGLPAENDDMGMHLFTRDEPDGWSESGLDWIDTGTMLSRMRFGQALAANGVGDVSWDLAGWLAAHRLVTAESVVDHFDRLLFQGAMAPSNRALLVRFATTDEAGRPLPLDPGRGDYVTRMRDLVGLILSMPQWHFQ